MFRAAGLGLKVYCLGFGVSGFRASGLEFGNFFVGFRFVYKGLCFLSLSLNPQPWP